MLVERHDVADLTLAFAHPGLRKIRLSLPAISWVKKSLGSCMSKFSQCPSLSVCVSQIFRDRFWGCDQEGEVKGAFKPCGCEHNK